AVVQHNSDVPYPSGTSDFHYEGELVVAIGRSGMHIAASDARNYVLGCAAGRDWTRRDLQNLCMREGLPRAVGNSLDRSAPIAKQYPAARYGHPGGRISLRVNGEVKQDSSLTEMIWDVPTIISKLSGLYQLRPGDIILTGTPEGVGPAKVGDRIEMRV